MGPHLTAPHHAELIAPEPAELDALSQTELDDHALVEAVGRHPSAGRRRAGPSGFGAVGWSARAAASAELGGRSLTLLADERHDSEVRT